MQEGGEMGQPPEPPNPDPEPAVEADGLRVSEELIWKARAEEAEAQCEAMEQRIGEVEAALEAAHASADGAERKREIERQLAQESAVDIETAALLTEMTIGQMDEPDVAAAVGELKRRKPFLFKGAAAPAPVRVGSAMSAAVDGTRAVMLDDLADEARETGDRRVLLKYLRQRRGV